MNPTNALDLTHPRNRRAALAAGLLVDITDVAHTFGYARRVAICSGLHAYYRTADELGDQCDEFFCIADLIRELKQSEAKLTERGLLFLDRPFDTWSIPLSAWDVVHPEGLNLLAWFGRSRTGRPCVTVARIECE